MKSLRYGTLALMACGLTAALFTWAGDNIEVVTGGGTVISHKLWDVSQFPLDWRLHEDGVITNDVNANGTPDLANADVQASVALAFQTWEAVAMSDITVAYGGETATADAGCDLVNIVTWSDTGQDWPGSPGVIARGITWSYVGADLVLDAVNRTTIGCGDTADVTLPVADYPDGMTLESGTIIDMDMTWNPEEFDYVTTPNATAKVVDVQSVATHEFGHMFGFSHVSLAFSGTDAVTMFPFVTTNDVSFQNNQRTLEDDDESSSGGGYPDTGYFPDGAAPHTTGEISGRVFQPDGTGASGVRVWAYRASDTSAPVYESFSATVFDWDPGLSPGDYRISGLTPGDYNVCIVAWNNGVPTVQAEDPGRYNLTTNNGAGNTGFGTECFDDAPSAAAAPDFAELDLVRTVTVTAGETTPNIDFVTGTQTTDFLLVMDRSGSMNWPSGTAGVSKIQALQNAANEMIDYLDLSGGHRLGLVQFEETLVPLTPVFDLQVLDGTTVGDAHDAVDTMSAGGWTNIIAGVEEAIDQLTTAAVPNPRQIMMVFSDGKHNRPVGSDLNDVHDPVVDNDIRFYSVGFGTDIDDAILSQIAADAGGVHVAEQDLGPLALSKHFLSIAASAADDTTLIDPRYSLAPGQTATLQVPVTTADRSLKFVAHWEVRDRERYDVGFVTPDGCRMDVAKPAGFGVRSGETYRIVEVPLPFTCEGNKAHEGVWRIEARRAERAGEEETVEIVVFGDSLHDLFAEAVRTDDGPVLRAKLLDRGRPVFQARLRAELLHPLPPTGDSEKQDGADRGEQGPHRSPVPKKERLKEVTLYDDGRHGDGKPRDGVFGAALALERPGTYHVRVMATYGSDKLQPTREATIAFYFDGREITVSRMPVRGKVRDRY